MRRLTSLMIWAGILLLIVSWLPVLLIIRIFDRDPVHYRTGRWFRRLGKLISRVNPNWQISIEGSENVDDRRPYVMVCNHQSNADIPVISNLPWEMKWVAKNELFKIPVLGNMMRLAGDIPVNRQSGENKIGTIKRAAFYLNNRCSVMFFPEGTRSRDGNIRAFNRGAFELAIRYNIPVLPMVLEGTQGCLPKNSWVFDPGVKIRLKVLDPVPVTGYGSDEAQQLSDDVRTMMIKQISEWRAGSSDQTGLEFR